MSHPLDRTVWNALHTRQRGLAVGDPAHAVRYQPEYGMFAATVGDSPEALQALAALVTPDGVAQVEAELGPLPPGCVSRSDALCHQMVLEQLHAAPSAHQFVPLTEADAPEMRALAELTRPGPFFSRTHQLGDFVGVKIDGRLVAMSGERMKVVGFTEVSAVCTHPDFRGRGYAGALMSHVAAQILARGETPFLHSYAANTGAIALYEALGFRFRAAVTMRVLAPA